MIPFREISAAATVRALDLCRRWLPRGRLEGHEWVALNPKRVDTHLGSFRINTSTGKWADFAVEGASGVDLLALYAYLYDLSIVEAARDVAKAISHPFGG